SNCPITYLFELVELSNDTIELGTFELCAGECFDWDNTTYCDPGNYLIESGADCPVFHHFEITTIQSDTTNLGIIDLCPDSCYQILNLEFCEAGLYTIADSMNNCVQWYTFAIQVLPPAVVDLGTITLCPDSCFALAGTAYCTPGSYEVFLPGTCPVLHSFELVEAPADTIFLGIQTVCEGDCFQYQGVDYCAGGSYTVIDQQAGQCPTITAFEVQVDSTTVVPLGLFELCLGDCFILNGESFCESGNYSLQAVDPSGCYLLYTFSLETVSGSNLTIGPVIELCDPTYTQYTISFNINSEFPPYSVNGQEITGNTFTSNPIPSGAPYAFEISDANDCSANEWVQGLYSCPLVCVTNAGEMGAATIYPCLDELFSAEHLGNAYLVGGDTLEYILHTNAGT
ncbi:MAG: hypothetical protein KDC44_00655, partial [Phaeodactylibacter sp.]|nr:hypothetical protein [Phaeodactylibacter sp.]